MGVRRFSSWCTSSKCSKTRPGCWWEGKKYRHCKEGALLTFFIHEVHDTCTALRAWCSADAEHKIELLLRENLYSFVDKFLMSFPAAHARGSNWLSPPQVRPRSCAGTGYELL